MSGSLVSAIGLPQFVYDMLASQPSRGGGLHNWLYRSARVLHPYRTPEEIIEFLPAATYGEPIKRNEIEDAVKNSAATAWKPGQSPQNITLSKAWPKVNAEARDAVILSGGGLVDLWEASPVRFEDNESHTEEMIDALFPGDPLLCLGRSNSGFDTRSRSEWLGKLAALQFIVPSPMTARIGRTQDGKDSARIHSKPQGPRRFLVIEQDGGTIDEQATVLLHLAERAPLAVAVHSGSKSIHGWFYCDGQQEEKLRRFMRYAVSLGADPATWTRSQFVRIPDGTRDNGKRQAVYLFNPQVLL